MIKQYSTKLLDVNLGIIVYEYSFQVLTSLIFKLNLTFRKVYCYSNDKVANNVLFVCIFAKFEITRSLLNEN